MREKQILSGIRLNAGNKIESIGGAVKNYMEETGVRPDYLCVLEEHHEAMLCSDAKKKTKDGRILKFKGFSVIVTPE
jgi:hypothetical protein